MNALVKLTEREAKIAELLAWGAAKKEVADRLYISPRTVENHTRNIFEKIGCGKVNELSAWWFCRTFGISFDLSPLKRKVLAVAMLLTILPSQVMSKDIYRVFRCRRARIEYRATRRGGHRKMDGFDFEL